MTPSRDHHRPAAPVLPIAALALLLGAGQAHGQTAPGLAATAPLAATVVPLPADSVYQLPVVLTDQAGRRQPLSARRGQPVLLSMFYTSCQFVCPMLVDAIHDTEARLGAAERARLPVLMVSFDPAHDTVAVLQQTAAQRRLDPARWTLARADAASTRKLAAVLGIQYRALPNGDFNHTTALILLDAEGRVAGRTSQLAGADPAFVKRVKLQLQDGSP